MDIYCCECFLQNSGWEDLPQISLQSTYFLTFLDCVFLLGLLYCTTAFWIQMQKKYFGDHRKRNATPVCDSLRQLHFSLWDYAASQDYTAAFLPQKRPYFI
uniref:Uncharacterized protein n=1 Tax=Micrurus lemniscatus lemniscatus TaxID=129467 RepID=A0A2D4IK48_MICLE